MRAYTGSHGWPVTEPEGLKARLPGSKKHMLIKLSVIQEHKGRMLRTPWKLRSPFASS